MEFVPTCFADTKNIVEAEGIHDRASMMEFHKFVIELSQTL
jgi:hypothetical protein